MMSGWILALVELHADTRPGVPPSITRTVGATLLNPRSNAVFLNEMAMDYVDPLRGLSGELRAAFRLPGEDLPRPADEDVQVGFRSEQGAELYPQELVAPADPGIYQLRIQLDRATRPIEELSLITLVPSSEKRQGKIGLYYLGSWPFEAGGTPKSPRYAPPRGFIKVTPENRELLVSEHFTLGDFLTKGQEDVWPKYLLLDPLLLDKMELVIQELERRGHDVTNVGVMSGFRTPHYNEKGGNTQGRASLSRHMYGDAADFFVDNDQNGNLDDLNGDGKVDTADAEIMTDAAETVERAHPSMRGGIGTYPKCCGHGPFIHVDVRGYQARWRG